VNRLGRVRLRIKRLRRRHRVGYEAIFRNLAPELGAQALGSDLSREQSGKVDTVRAEPLTDASSLPLSSYLSQSSFLMPNLLLPDSAWLEHAPFAFWLVDALRPKQVLELGCFSGFSYSVFCQAVQTLGLDTRCYAVDTWLGDEHSGFYGLEVFKTFNAYNEAYFSSFSQLIRSDFDEALQYFPDGSLDLLHIDGKHSYEAVKSDYSNWRCKMSDRGVILFHDTNVHERDFGVARLWQELNREYRNFEFLHGYGLGVLGVGRNLPPALEFLFELTSDATSAQQVRRAYSRLGQSVAEVTRRPVLDAKIRELETRDTPAEAVNDHTVKMAKLEAELARQVRRLNFLAAVASQRTAEVETVAQQLAAAQAELAAAQAKLAAAQAELGAVRGEKEQLQALNAAEMQSLQAAAAACQARSENLQRQIDGLFRSRSWRITRPLRGITRMLRVGG
jgi:hypothetical protein